MRCIVTGCAGFVGSHLTDRLLAMGYDVVGLDNFSTGRYDFLTKALTHKNFFLHHVDLTSIDQFIHLTENADIVFHLAANADVRFGTEHPCKDLEQNTIVTSHVLEAMRRNKIKKIVFASTGINFYHSSDTPKYTPSLSGL